MSKSLFRRLEPFLLRHDIVAPFVWRFVKYLKPIPPSSGTTPDNVPTILGLNPFRFRGDLQILADTKRFRVLGLELDKYSRLLEMFLTPGVDMERLREHRHDSEVQRVHESLHRFLVRFLPKLYAKVPVDMVLSAAVHYIQDEGWGAASNKVGVPFVALHRENTFVSAPALIRAYKKRLASMGCFRGSHIIVQNEAARDVFIKTGYIEEQNISALGCLRMDGLLSRLEGNSAAERGKRKAVFFSFPRGGGMLGMWPHFPKDKTLGYPVLFQDFHRAAAEVARACPDCEVIIKPKYAGWNTEIRLNIGEADMPENLRILPHADVHQLIGEASVAVGFQSTTLLESGLRNIPVVVPYFAEATKPEFQDYIRFKADFHAFNVAESKAQLISMVCSGLEDGARKQHDLSNRMEVFTRYVGQLDDNATKRYADTLAGIIETTG